MLKNTLFFISILVATTTQAQKLNSETAAFKLQQVEFFEKKYTVMLKDKQNDKDISGVCNENTVRAEATKMLTYLDELDQSPLAPQMACHQKRLEAKIHGILGGLFKDGHEGKTMFSLLKQNMNQPSLSKCPEMMLYYVRTIASFTQMRTRGIVMMRLGVKLDDEVPKAFARLETLRKTPGAISDAEYKEYLAQLNDY